MTVTRTVEKTMHFRVVKVLADGTEVRGELFKSVGEALIEVTAITDDLAKNPHDTDVVEVRIWPVLVR